MKIAITGATGFVGANLVRHFAQKGHEVVAIGRGEPPAALLRFAKYRKADLRQPLPPIEADVVVHAAALADDHAPMGALHQANVLGTMHVRAASKGCGLFIQVSSSSVYEPRRGGIEERHAGGRLSAYGQTKLAADHWLLSQNLDDQRVCILRPRAIYGIGDRVLLPKMLKLLVADRLALLPGRLQVTSSMTHVGNLCLAVERCIEVPSAAGVFNIADDENYRLRAVFEAMLGGLSSRKPVFFPLPGMVIGSAVQLKSALGIRSGISPQAWQYLSEDAVLNLEKAKNELGYQPQGRFFDQLDGLAEWVGRVGRQRVASADPQLPWL